jgi:hypothetical protein
MPRTASLLLGFAAFCLIGVANARGVVPVSGFTDGGGANHTHLTDGGGLIHTHLKDGGGAIHTHLTD